MIETRGQQLKRRMDALGVNQTQLHQASSLSPKTISRALNDRPQTRDTTYTQLARVLDDIEADRADGEVRYLPESEVSDGRVHIALVGLDGLETVTFSGPPENIAVVKAAALEFYREARGAGTSSST